MKRMVRRFFGSEIEFLMRLLARAAAAPAGAIVPVRRPGPARVRKRRPPRKVKPRGEPGILRSEVERLVLLFRRNRGRVLGATASVLAHLALFFTLLQIPMGKAPEEDPPLEITLRAARAPLAAAAKPSPPVEKPSAPSPAPADPPVPPPPALVERPLEAAVPDPPAEASFVPDAVASSTELDSKETGSGGTGQIARPEPEGRPGPPTVLGVGVSPPGGDGDGRGGDGQGDGYGSRTRGKASALRRFGGNGGTEDAVAHGLAWLAAHQDLDGGWSAADFSRHCRQTSPCLGKGLPEFDMGVTSLCALAFLGAGQVPGPDGPYGRTLERAMEKILSGQRVDGALGARGERYLYNHALATFALCEAYAISRDHRYLRPSLEALRFSAASQQQGGGWDYSDSRTGRNDLSITGWQVMAFRAAQSAGLPIPDDTMQGLRRYLDQATTPNGEAVYATSGAGAARRGINMTSVALLSKLYVGTPVDDPWVRIAADRILAHPPEPELASDWDRHFQSSYYWYSATLCLFHLGGKRWEAWNHFLQRKLLPLQCRSAHEDGSWSPDPNWLGAMGGRIFTTATNVLTLEVYYRYPPLHTYGVAESRRDRPRR